MKPPIKPIDLSKGADGLYHPGTRLEWWGTLVGGKFQDKFLIAAPTQRECLDAAKIFFLEAKKENVRPVLIRKRKI
jgi:hypothetical protein